MKTIYFPDKRQLIGGVDTRSERSAYLDGIAILQEAVALTEMYSPVIRDAASEVSRLAQKTPMLGSHLAQCSEKVFGALTGTPGPTVGDLKTEVERLHLRQSMKERFVDLAVQIESNSRTSLSLGYHEAELENVALQRDVLTMRSCQFPDVAIIRTLGIARLPQLSAEFNRQRLYYPDLPRYPDRPQETYAHTNSQGITYYLHKTQVTLRGGLPQEIYFFAKVPNNGKGIPAPLPANRVVKENPRNGFLTISKKGK